MSEKLEQEMRTHPNCEFYGSAIKEVLEEKDAIIEADRAAIEAIVKVLQSHEDAWKNSGHLEIHQDFGHCSFCKALAIGKSRLAQ